MIKIISFILLVLLLLTGIPLAFIWAINTLFCLGIAFTFKTWLAAAILTIVVTSNNISRNHSDSRSKYLNGDLDLFN